MPRPRRKVSKQKAALRQHIKKKRQQEEEDTGSSALEELKNKQKERRRRILWGDNADGGFDDDEQEEDEEYRDSVDELDEDDYHDPEGEDDEGEACCSNPECRNFSIDHGDDFTVPRNAVLVRSDHLGVPALTIGTLNNALDLKGKAYTNLDIQRAGERDFLLSMQHHLDLERIARDRMIVVDGFHYPAHVLPTGSDGDFFRDYYANSRNPPTVCPHFSALRNDLGTGIMAKYQRNAAKYSRLEAMIRRGSLLQQG